MVEIESTGIAEFLVYKNINTPSSAATEVQIQQQAIGFNFLDIFYRNGTFPLEQFPAILGFEAAGVIAAIGSDVTNYKVGDRIAYYKTIGAYAERRNIDISEIFRLPEDISFELAPSMMIKGLTAHMLIKKVMS